MVYCDTQGDITDGNNSFQLVQVGFVGEKLKEANYLIQTVYDGNEQQLVIRFHQMTNQFKFDFLAEYVVRDFKDREIQLGDWSMGNYLSLTNEQEYDKRLSIYQRVHNSFVSYY